MTSAAAAELVRQDAFALTQGAMIIDLLGDSCGEGWLHVNLRSGGIDGVPVARTDGVTLFAAEEQLSLLQGLRLNY